MKIIPRWRWGARKTTVDTRVLPVSTVYIHHTVDASGVGMKPKDERAAMRRIQAFHMDSRGYADLGYLFVVFPSGNVYAGRKGTWKAVGAHTEGQNTTSVGIAFYGNFENEQPTKEAVRSVGELIRSGKAENRLTARVTIKGHRDSPGAATACPGVNLYNTLDKLKRAVRA